MAATASASAATASASAATAAAEMASSWVDTAGGIAWESKRIVSSHSRHFLALSVLFLLPLSLLLISIPSFLLHAPNPSPQPPQTFLRGLSPPHRRPFPSDALLLICAFAAALLALSAAAAVTHSARRGFFGRPVRLLSALHSLPCSLLRLLATLIAADAVLCAVLALPVSLLLLALRALPHLGLQHLSSFACGIATIGYAVLVVLLQLHWSLASVVAVVESSWGFDPLRRSTYLVKGMRWVALAMFLFFATGIGLMMWGAYLGDGFVEAGDWKAVVPAVVRIVCASAVTVVLLLYSLVSSVVLYMYCKALQGELAYEIAEEFAEEYVRLPFDDMKVPHIVSVVHC